MLGHGAPGGETEARGGPASTSGASATVGTTRNRTDLFLKYRRQARGGSRPLPPPGRSASDGGETARLVASALGGGLSDAEAGVAGVVAALPPRYVDAKEQVRAEMGVITAKMADLRALHGRATLSKFDDTNDDEIQVEVLTQQITKLFRKCEGRLQALGRGSGAGAGGGAGEADGKVQRNVQRTLAVELQRLSVAFRQQQKQYLQRLRSKNGGGGGGGGGGGNAFLDDGRPGSRGPEDGADAGFDPGFSDVQSLAVDTLSVLIDERDREVARIVASINELAQVMKDLSVLVIDQGTVLDRIDYNMEQTSMRVEEGVRQLEKAERKQKQSGMALCILLLCAAIVVMIIIIVFKALLF